MNIGKLIVKLIDVAVMVATIVVIVLASITAIPPLFGVNPYFAKSGSMEPVIHVGALEFVDTKQKDLVVGDIATFRLMDEDGLSDELVTHRVSKINGDGTYTLKGDANENEDFITYSQEQIVGRHIFSVPNLGYVFAALQGKVKTVIIVMVLGFNMINLMIQKAFDDEEEDKKEEKTIEPTIE